MPNWFYACFQLNLLVQNLTIDNLSPKLSVRLIQNTKHKPTLIIQHQNCTESDIPLHIVKPKPHPLPNSTNLTNDTTKGYPEQLPSNNDNLIKI